MSKNTMSHVNQLNEHLHKLVRFDQDAVDISQNLSPEQYRALSYLAAYLSDLITGYDNPNSILKSLNKTPADVLNIVVPYDMHGLKALCPKERENARQLLKPKYENYSLMGLVARFKVSKQPMEFFYKRYQHERELLAIEEQVNYSKIEILQMEENKQNLIRNNKTLVSLTSKDYFTPRKPTMSINPEMNASSIFKSML